MKIAIVGLGAMGTALAEGLKSYNLVLVDRARPLKEPVDLVVLAVKPKDLLSCAKSLPRILCPVLSVLGGVSAGTLRDHFPEADCVQAMCNLAVRYGKGVFGAVDGVMKPATRALVEQVGKTLGTFSFVTAQQITAISSLAGSGPAFWSLLIEASIEAGIHMGFKVDQAKDMVVSTVKGAVMDLEQGGLHPAQLKWQVSSPAGSTIAGLLKLEEGAVRASIVKAYLATYEKAKG